RCTAALSATAARAGRTTSLTLATPLAAGALAVAGTAALSTGGRTCPTTAKASGRTRRLVLRLGRGRLGDAALGGEAGEQILAGAARRRSLSRLFPRTAPRETLFGLTGQIVLARALLPILG